MWRVSSSGYSQRTLAVRVCVGASGVEGGEEWDLAVALAIYFVLRSLHRQRCLCQVNIIVVLVKVQKKEE